MISLACQRPEGVDRLEAQMTQEMIAEEAAKQGTHLSRSSVQRILANAELRPHRQRYFLFTAKDHPEYESRRDAICGLYTRRLPWDEVAICFDEKSGMQVLGTPHSGKPASLGGRPELVEHSYKRLGTRTLAIAVRVDTGELVEWDLFKPKCYRTAEAIDMLRHIAAALPEMRVIHLVWDNAPTHRSGAMRDFLASDEGQRFRVYFTPTHASWLNQAEGVLSKISRRFLKNRRFASVAAFDEILYGGLEIFNGTLATPCRWRYNPGRKAA